jgi:putative ABC transport system permease protein
MIIKNKKWTLFQAWVWRMAWKDARHNFSRLGLFLASLIAGIAAVVALDSLRQSMETDIDSNARNLIGADLVVSGDKKFGAGFLKVIDSTRFEQAGETSMASMIYVLKNGQSRLIRLVAFDGGFPFYGDVKTDPAGAFNQIKTNQSAVIDQTLGKQFDIAAGDSIKVGNLKFAVAGFVNEIPGGGGILATFTPSVYISMANLAPTGLIQFGSRVTYKKYLRIDNEKEVAAVNKVLEPVAKGLGYNIETVEKRKEGLGKGFHRAHPRMYWCSQRCSHLRKRETPGGCRSQMHGILRLAIILNLFCSDICLGSYLQCYRIFPRDCHSTTAPHASERSPAF